MAFQLMTLPASKNHQDASARLRALLQHAKEIIRREPKTMIELLDAGDEVLGMMEQVPATTDKKFEFRLSDLPVAFAVGKA